jgi:hypothetical protein
VKKTRGAERKVMTVMGRRVIHNSPAKFPESVDPMSPDAFDKMIEEAAQRQPGTMSRARQDMRDAQQESAAPAKKLQEGIDYYFYERLGGKKRGK